MKSKLKNLQDAWQEYKNKTGATQVTTTKNLGWASATLGLYLNGRRELTHEHAAEIANLLHVDVGTILDGVVAHVREIKIIATASGNNPPQKTKKIRYEGARHAIFCDIPVFIEGATLAIPAGVTLLVADADVKRLDERWPQMTTRYWVIKSQRKIKIVLSDAKPRSRSGEQVYVLTSALFI
ncbi:MAG: hypothetical protein VXB01_08610 [Opitutae bacterium]